MIVHIDVEADVELFLREVELVGSEELISTESQRFFIVRALQYVATTNSIEDTVGRVMQKIKESIRTYYYQESNTSAIEQRLIDSWITLTQAFVEQLRSYMYDERGRRNNKGLALSKYNRNGEVEVIVFEMEEEMDGSGKTEWR